MNLIVRSMGYETSAMETRTKLFYCLRLVQLCERNFNYVDLGPPGTGKSYAVQELSPYAALLTGPTTVANMFGHMNGRRKGMVELWDSVGFDEVADLESMPKEVITTLKTYCESGKFQRGAEESAGYASIGEVAPKNWTGGIVKNSPQKKERSACPKNDVSTVPS